MTGKRVGVIGNGSTGTRFIVAAPIGRAPDIFQRSPQYCVPAGNRGRSGQIASQENFDATGSRSATQRRHGLQGEHRRGFSVSDEERERIFQQAWDKGGGFRFMFGRSATSPPTRRPTRRRRSSSAEDRRDREGPRHRAQAHSHRPTPAARCATPATTRVQPPQRVAGQRQGKPDRAGHAAGDRTTDGALHELDVLVFATGFDAVDGNYVRPTSADATDRASKSTGSPDPSSYLGVAASGFPNMFMILGPNGPFTNLPPTIETQVEWIADVIRHVSATQTGRIDLKPDAEADWTKTCVEVAAATVFGKVDSWIFGANIPGKKKSVLFYLGGLGEYRKILAAEAAAGYPSFSLRTPPLPVGASRAKRPSRPAQPALQH